MHIPNLESLPFFAMAGGIGMFWNQIKEFLVRIKSFFIINVELSEDTAKAVTCYCWNHFKRSPFGNRSYRGDVAFVRPLGRVQSVASEIRPNQQIIFWNGWKPLLLGAKHTNEGDTFGDLAVLTLIRFTFDIDTLLIKCLDYFNLQKTDNTKNSRFRVVRIQGHTLNKRSQYATSDSSEEPPSKHKNNSFPNNFQRILKWNFEDIGEQKSVNPLEDYALSNELKEALEEFSCWKNSEQWFKEKKVPYRRGWLLHGPAGTGKSALVRLIAQLNDIPVWVFDLSRMSNEELYDNWKSMQENTPCIALLEDLDCVFEGRKNVLGENGGGLTFDCLLNCLSGVEKADGLFTIVTTNKLEFIDPALGIPSQGESISSRPGRLDRVIRIGELTAECRQQIANRILSDWPDIISSFVEKGNGYTGAQFTELCSQEALKRYWEDKGKVKV